MIFNITIDNWFRKLDNLDEKLEDKKYYKLIEQKKSRSVEINNHFYGHIYQISQESGASMDYIKALVLLLAVEIGAVDGGSSYPFVIVNDVLYPNATSTCNNKQMMTAVEACHLYAARNEIGLREKQDWLDEL